MDYTSITPAQRRHMLDAVGVRSIDDLFAVIPPESRCAEPLDLPPAASELELQRELTALSRANRGADAMACFMGAGAYDHFIPAFIDQMILRGEYLTAYTPYQAEASQGSLQAFFEFQSLIARLTQMDFSNASLYDGATAVCEAVTLALNVTGRRRVLVASTLHPDTLWTLRTQLCDYPVELVTLPASDEGVVSCQDIERLADADTACIVAQSPNVFGLIEDWEGLFKAFQHAAAGKGAAPLNIAVFNPIACSLLKTPGECGADIAVGEGQPLGIPLQLGGPYLGLFAAKKKLIRKAPGRLVGMTQDASGRRSFCLILQTREQHIRGARATSNICTNQGLLALRACMHMSLMGPDGLGDVATQCFHKAHELARRISEIPGCSLRHGGDFFHEFVVVCPRSAKHIINAAKADGLLAGVSLASDRLSKIGADNELLIAVTEKRTRDEMESLLRVFKREAS